MIEPTTSCPCGAELPYASCCAPIIAGERSAPTAEALMRSRYSAHVAREIDYLSKSLHSTRRAGWSREAALRWAKGVEWMGLEIVGAVEGGAGDLQGTVEFIASYKEDGELQRHREVSQFVKEGDDWYYLKGQTPKVKATPPTSVKIGRNDPCICGSKKKYKKCCGR